MSEIKYREYRHRDAESFLCLHNSVFPAISADAWREFSRRDVTAAVAAAEDTIVGAVPFHLRAFRVRPGVVVRVAWEFSVCVRADLRGTGVGSRLMDTAKKFLHGRCVAMAVYRDDERSPAYRYYNRNGHHDVMYMRRWQHTGSPNIPIAPLETWTWEQFLHHELEVLEIFEDAYGAWGGFPERRRGFYRSAVRTAVYYEIPLVLSVLVRRDSAGRLAGYAILGEERLNPTLHLMEIAARNHDIQTALVLLAAFAAEAAQRDLPAVASVPDSFPYLAALQTVGFQPHTRAHPSTMVMMFHILDPEGLARATWRESDATADLDVIAWTPLREVWLHRALRSAKRHIVLEMKEETLTRLLLGRLDLNAAFMQQLVTATGADDATLTAIADALPFVPWTYHYLDYV